MTRRPDYCPIGGEPCQSLCEAPCGSRKPLTDEQISDMRGADLGALNFVTLRQFRAIARAVESAHGIKDPAHGQ